jgi:hypothetical protein
MEPSAFFRCVFLAYVAGAIGGYVTRKSGLDQLVMARVQARIDKNNRRYAAILAEEIGDRIIVVSNTALLPAASCEERETEAGQR